MFASVLLACLLVIVGSTPQDFNGTGERTGNASSLPSHNGDLADPVGDVLEAAATLAEQPTESLPMPAESEGDEAAIAAASAPGSSQAPVVVDRHTNVVPSRDIRHPARGPPAA
ncbi:hypothetical protein ASD77_01465 [Pseudoxanthomonas sp. Root65]|nr:hypothetical protein ASD77_01465 [Pseudoxanthomonas sp. Root65]